jgi:2-polyprenyl-3-methyl-5-hydroxy-6-metoxy-1,4-benzoquinol methylase
LSDSRLKRLVTRLVGTLDLHGHYRIRALLDWVEQREGVWGFPPMRVLEVGCGWGVNLFELAERFPRMSGLGCDLNTDAIHAATAIAERLFPGRLTFRISDATAVDVGEPVDAVLLIDVLEHLPNPRALLEQVVRGLREGGEVLVSVPTPRYPLVFGRRFHESIGHLVDGYTLDTLNALMPDNLRLVHFNYNTGLFASALCALYYRWLLKVRLRKIGPALRLIPLLFQRWDPLNGPARSSSLFAVYRKTFA